MAQATRFTARAERTRARILDEAERLFAEEGFAAARLEEVAARAGIRRASIVYYFRDKRELYDAVLARVFGGLLERLEELLLAPRPLRERVDGAISAWVDYVAERPAFARLLLREIAGASRERPILVDQTQPFAELVLRVARMQEERSGEPVFDVEPEQLASVLAGATLFYVAGIPALLPQPGFDPFAPEQLEAHRALLRRLVEGWLEDPRTG